MRKLVSKRGDIIKEFSLIKLDRDNDSYGYYKTHKLSNNQTIGIYLFRQENISNNEYYVLVLLANKKKYIKEFINEQRDILSDKETGKCGLEGLLWAKRQLIEFEESRYCKNGDIISIGWTDNRRRDIYKYGLKKYGYIIGNRYGRRCLYKKIVK